MGAFQTAGRTPWHSFLSRLGCRLEKLKSTELFIRTHVDKTTIFLKHKNVAKIDHFLNKAMKKVNLFWAFIIYLCNSISFNMEYK